jgi:hypothetical protein
MTLRWIALAALACSCKKAPAVDEAAGSGSAVTPSVGNAGSAVTPPPAPAWRIESHPLELACGDQPLALPAPASATPVADRPLARAVGIAPCHDQASVAAACACLAKAVDTWGPTLGLSATAGCEPASMSSPDAQVVEVRSQPADTAATSGGEAFVLVARHGTTWSPVAVIDAAPDVDLSQTPKASHRATIASLEARPIADGTMLWIESRSEVQERSMGDLDRDGEALGTICVVPSAASAAPFCYAPLRLGAWSYALTVADGTCAIHNVATFAATIDATSATLRLVHGADADGVVGRYRL